MPLRPLARVVHTPAVLRANETVHRWGCPDLDGIARTLNHDTVLWRNRAPTAACPACRPTLELHLSAGTTAEAARRARR